MGCAFDFCSTIAATTGQHCLLFACLFNCSSCCLEYTGWQANSGWAVTYKSGLKQLYRNVSTLEHYGVITAHQIRMQHTVRSVTNFCYFTLHSLPDEQENASCRVPFPKQNPEYNELYHRTWHVSLPYYSAICTDIKTEYHQLRE